MTQPEDDAARLVRTEWIVAAAKECASDYHMTEDETAKIIAKHLRAHLAERDARERMVTEAIKPVEAAAAMKAPFWEDDWNPDAHVEITLTIAECRALRAALSAKSDEQTPAPTEPSQ